MKVYVVEMLYFHEGEDTLDMSSDVYASREEARKRVEQEIEDLTSTFQPGDLDFDILIDYENGEEVEVGKGAFWDNGSYQVRVREKEVR